LSTLLIYGKNYEGVLKMSKNSVKKASLKIFWKALVWTILAISLIVIGFLRAGYFSGNLV